MEEQKEPIEQILTKEDLKDALQAVGLGKGRIVEVHASLSSFGYLIGGACTVVDALMETVGSDGTILMPMQTSDNSEPSDWENPPVQPSLYSEVREKMPAFDPWDSDLRGMGRIAENFRHRPGVIISGHPRVSYGAWGRYAKLMCNHQSLHFPLSEESPTARLCEMKGDVLLLGTDFDSCTCMHLAEYRSECRPVVLEGSAVEENGKAVWKKYLDLKLNSSDFVNVRPIMEKKNMIREVMLGSCHIRCFSAADAVDEAVRYFERTVVYDLYR